jgi:hypothetical protein
MSEPKIGDLRLIQDGHGRYVIQSFGFNSYYPSKPAHWLGCNIYGFQGVQVDAEKARAWFAAAVQERDRLAKFDEHTVIVGPS